MIAALHAGDLIYGKVLPGGVAAFAAQNEFRGVVYRDGYDTIWRYGTVSEREAAHLEPCE